MSQHWGYSDENGPNHWHKMYPKALGKRQSPIDIKTSLCTKCPQSELPSLKYKYDSDECKSLVNCGYSWRVDVITSNSELSGGPLKSDIFKLAQFHCHWGCDETNGSEHTVDGNSYAGELHFVHWNTSKYASFEEAANAPDGLAVLGVFLKVASKTHPELDKVTSLLKFVAHKGDRITIPNGCDPTKLLPSSPAYWTYEGSLTTPPCNESVIWIVFKNPIEVSRDQLETMRSLNCYDVKEKCPCDPQNGKVKINFRPPLPLGNRELREVGQ